MEQIIKFALLGTVLNIRLENINWIVFIQLAVQLNKLKNDAYISVISKITK